MRNLKKKVVVFATAASLAVVSMTGCASFENADTVATVGGDKIPAGVANFYARYQQGMIETNLGSMLGDNMWTQEVSEGKTYEDNVKDSVMDALQQMYILEDHMAEYEVVLTDEEKSAIQEAAKKFDEGNELEAKELVSGETEYVERVLTLLTIQKKMTDAVTKDVSTEVSDEEAAQKSMQYVSFPYTTTDEEGNSKTLTDEEKAALKETAAAFLEGAKAAEDFAAYATEQGKEAQTATFDSESTSPAAELIAAADSLGVGGFTDVIETENGLYVAKVTSLLDRDATDAKKETIVNSRKSEKFNGVYDGWKKDTKIKVNKDVWAKVDFQDVGVTVKQNEEEPYTEYLRRQLSFTESCFFHIVSAEVIVYEWNFNGTIWNTWNLSHNSFRSSGDFLCQTGSQRKSAVWIFRICRGSYDSCVRVVAAASGD